MTAPTTPYTAALAGREPLEAMRSSVARIQAMTDRWSDADFERRPAPGKWNAREILIHLAQTEWALGARARMALVTSDYVAQNFDQDAWMARERGLAGPDAVAALVALSRMDVSLFASLSAVDRAIAFPHPEYGSISVDWIIHQLAGHQLHHVAQLEAVSTPSGG